MREEGSNRTMIDDANRDNRGDDPEAVWERRFQRFEERLRRQAVHLSSRMRLRVDVTDLVQEVFLVAVQKLDRQAGERPRPDTVHCLDQYLLDALFQNYRRNHAKCRDIRRERRAEAEENAGSNEPLSPLTSPTGAVVRDERDRIIRDALSLLTEKERVVILLKEWEGLSIAEIAQTMGMSTTAVTSCRSRAYLKLRSILKDLSE
jgi:RNA polymerase sigma factor (sigma-70 family)